MKYIKVILVLLFSLSVIGTNDAQRNIILSHGFNGSDASWNVYQPFLRGLLTTPREVWRVSFTSTDGVLTGVNEVRNQVADNSQNIAVVHSMGGLVWRTLDVEQPSQKAGGIITLGTPNRGSTALRALQNGTADALLNEGCNKIGLSLSSATLAAWAAGYGGIYTFAAGTTLTLFQRAICTDIIDRNSTLFPTVTAPNSIRDMSEGSGVITQLNNSNTPTFKIGLFGVEASPVHMRLFSSNRENQAPSQKPLGVDNTDEDLVTKFHMVSDLVGTIEAIFIVATIHYSYNAIWNWPLLIPAMICAWAAYEWGDLYRWLAQSESKWHAIIGAGGFFTETVNTRVFTCQSAMQDIYDAWESRRISVGQMRLIRERLLADPNCFTMMQIPIQFPINNQSDGLFNAGTARIPTDPNDERHVINLPVDGANHQELLNHRNMTIRFREIFSGQTRANSFFITQ
jgi:pimeloyl-ACP methyl ester carboxylesterase